MTRTSFWDLFPRYAWATLLLPLISIAVSLYALVLIRLAGPCISRVSGIPEDDHCVTMSGVTWTLLLISIPLGFGGPFHWWFLFNPFNISFPEVSTLKKKRNLVLFFVPLVLAYIFIFIIVSVSSIWRAPVMAMLRSAMLIYLLIAIPVVWRRDIADRERNIFLIRMEHQWTCCEETIFIRPPNPGVLEISLYLLVLGDVVVYLVRGFEDISISPILLLFFIAIGYAMWVEKDQHFYHDFPYTYLLCLYPTVIMELFLFTFQMQQTLMLNNEAATQIGVIILVNIFLLIMARIVRRWAMACTEDLRKVVVLLFPARFIEHIFQYLILYTMRDIFSATFWSASAIVLVTNVLDTSGLLGDLYDSLLERVRNRKFSPNNEMDYPLTQRSASDETGEISRIEQAFGNGVRPLDGSFNASAVASPEYLAEMTVFALEQIYQKCYVMLLIPIMVAVWMWADIYLSQMFNVPEGCSYSCNFSKPVRGWNFIFYRVAVMFSQYIIVVLIAMLVWRFRLKGLISKYPHLSRYLSENQPADDEASSNVPKRKKGDAQKEIELKRVFRGHLSASWGDPECILYIVSTIVFVSFTLIARSAETKVVDSFFYELQPGTTQ